jgi:hypothetical protein
MATIDPSGVQVAPASSERDIQRNCGKLSRQKT